MDYTVHGILQARIGRRRRGRQRMRWLDGITERTDAEAEAPILWPPDAKNGLAGKDPDAGED